MRMHSCVLTGSRKCLKVRMGHVRPIPTGASSPPPWGLLKVNQKNLVRFLSVFLFSIAKSRPIVLKRQNIIHLARLRDNSHYSSSPYTAQAHYHIFSDEIVLER